MNNKKLLLVIQRRPTPKNIRWLELERLLSSFGARRREGKGSHVVFELNGEIMTGYRPHPGSDAPAYLVREVVALLRRAGFVE